MLDCDTNPSEAARYYLHHDFINTMCSSISILLDHDMVPNAESIPEPIAPLLFQNIPTFFQRYEKEFKSKIPEMRQEILSLIAVCNLNVLVWNHAITNRNTVLLKTAAVTMSRIVESDHMAVLFGFDRKKDMLPLSPEQVRDYQNAVDAVFEKHTFFDLESL